MPRSRRCPLTLGLLPWLAAPAGTSAQEDPVPWADLLQTSATERPDIVACSGWQEDVGACPGLPSCVPEEHCEFGEWESWYYAGHCLGICFRKRDIRQFSNDLGRPCSGPKIGTKACAEGDDSADYRDQCPHAARRGPSVLRASSASPGALDCRWSEWSHWSACTRDCGGGEKTRDRHIAVSPLNGGKPCDPIVREEVAACNLQQCSLGLCQDAAWGPWGTWGACSATCGSGLQVRRRVAETEADSCGQPLSGSAHEFRECAVGKARCPGHKPQVCKLAAWEEWGACPATCGSGQRARRRRLLPSVRSSDEEPTTRAARGGPSSAASALYQGLARNVAYPSGELQSVKTRDKALQEENIELEQRLTAMRNRSVELERQQRSASVNAQELADANEQLRMEERVLQHKMQALQASLGRLRYENQELLKEASYQRRHQDVLAICGFLTATALFCVACLAWGCMRRNTAGAFRSFEREEGSERWPYDATAEAALLGPHRTPPSSPKGAPNWSPLRAPGTLLPASSPTPSSPDASKLPASDCVE